MNATAVMVKAVTCAICHSIRGWALHRVEALLNWCAVRLMHAMEAFSSAADKVGGKA